MQSDGRVVVLANSAFNAVTGKTVESDWSVWERTFTEDNYI